MVRNISHSKRIQRDITINIHRFSYKVHVILVRFKWNLNFLDKFSKKAKTNFIENPSSGSRVAEGRVDRTKLKVAFRNFSKAPKKGLNIPWLGGRG